MKYLCFLLCIACLLCGCSQTKTKIKVAATPVPHADLLYHIQDAMKKEGIHLEILEVDDYNLPNRLLAEKQVDANFFQHEPFLKTQEQQFGYRFVVLSKVHLEPLGVYSKKHPSLSSTPCGASIAIPSDPTNESRALKLLQDLGLIELKSIENIYATPLDIFSNPLKLKFIEVDAALLPRVLPDVDFSVIPANFALGCGIHPGKEALALETRDSPYTNLLVVREGDENREELKSLARWLTSEKLKEYIKVHYSGEIVPAF